MTWVITPQQKIDPDAAVYLSLVEAADGQALEAGVRTAIENFVLGCKADGIWNAIKASCILAGARTLSGALVPLVGSAPTNVDGLFASGDYDRKIGLLGNGTTKRLDSSRSNSADPQDSKHIAAFVSSYPSASGAIAGSGTWLSAGQTNLFYDFSASRTLYRVNGGGAGGISSGLPSPGFTGANRSEFGNITTRKNQANFVTAFSSQQPIAANISIFSAGTTEFIAARLAFYSVGESLNLALLDARVTALINAFGAAIP